MTLFKKKATKPAVEAAAPTVPVTPSPEPAKAIVHKKKAEAKVVEPEATTPAVEPVAVPEPVAEPEEVPAADKPEEPAKEEETTEPEKSAPAEKTVPPPAKPTSEEPRSALEGAALKKTKKKGSINLSEMALFAPRLTIQERINFARHLSVAIKSGLPLLEGLRLVENQAASKGLTKIIQKVMDDVNNGQSLAQALGRFEHTFGDFYVSMVKVGEASGNLSSSLLYLSQEIKKQRDISGKTKSAMIYPMVILFATIAMSVALTVFIFPKIVPIFVSLKVDLPITTRFLIQLMEFLQTKGIITGIALVVGFIVARSLVTVKSIHYYFDRATLSIPVVSKIVTSTTLANFTRSLAVLLKSGMTLMDALAVTKVTFHNLYYRRQIEKIIDVVRRGEEMAHYMATLPRFFPPMLSGMIKVGENTGNLEENLMYLSEYYTEEVENSVRDLTSLLEPILILGMGGVVAFIALSIIMPIYSITQGLKVK
jgi:type II secretory pathway component PulF